MKALALAALVMALAGWTVDSWERFYVWPASSPEKPVGIEVSPPGSRSSIFFFDSPPHLKKVLKKAGFPTAQASGDPVIMDGTRVLISAGPDGETAAVLETFLPVTALASGRRMDINQAGYRDLILLPGIGPKTARLILADRRIHGPLADLGDLARVNGVGTETVARLRGLATVDHSNPR
jgi:DNA uptake protein ComE-like DNA-binding protein